MGSLESRLATIDLGTNTVRLLVVETGGARRWRVLAQDQIITRLGEGASATGRLGEVPMARTVEVVTAFCRQAESLGAGEIVMVATSAVREASNRQLFLARVRRATGREVRVVAGEEEARLSFLGVLSGIDEVGGDLLLMDIGGGSTEFTLARDRQVVTALSIPLGVVPLAEQYMTQGPVDWARYALMDREVRARLAREVLPAFRSSRPGRMVGMAGTITTLAALDQALAAYDPEKVQGYRLQRHRIERLLARLGALSLAARANVPSLEPGRADLIIPGIAVCLAAMDSFGFDSLLASEFALREGILVDYLARASGGRGEAREPAADAGRGEARAPAADAGDTSSG
jgi:exopolyphosphatase/guanosine-5'-triphosphate,3'-diphosphate pyrophosphatase